MTATVGCEDKEEWLRIIKKRFKEEVAHKDKI